MRQPFNLSPILKRFTASSLQKPRLFSAQVPSLRHRRSEPRNILELRAMVGWTTYKKLQVMVGHMDEHRTSVQINERLNLNIIL